MKHINIWINMVYRYMYIYIIIAYLYINIYICTGVCSEVRKVNVEKPHKNSK